MGSKTAAFAIGVYRRFSGLLSARPPAPPDGLQYTTHQMNDWRVVIISGRGEMQQGFYTIQSAPSEKRMR
jgi:hypothetical protein